MSGGSRENSKRSKEEKDAALARRLANLRPFKKGQSGNPKGRKPGQRNFETLFNLALEELGHRYGISPDQVEIAMHMASITKAIKGDFFHYQELANRIHGKPTQKMEVDHKGKTLADLFSQLNARDATTRIRAGKATRKVQD